MSVEQLNNLTQSLIPLLSPSTYNYEVADEIFNKIKDIILDISIQNPNINQNSLLRSSFIQAYEAGALHYLYNDDVLSFNRTFSALKSYYNLDGRTELASISNNSFLIVGLALMHLLVDNRMAEFHSLLEQITPQDLTSSDYIALPLSLEKSLVEGSALSYQNANSNSIHPLLLQGIKFLETSSRIERAAAYAESWEGGKAKAEILMNKLGLSSEQELVDFVNENFENWKLVNVNGQNWVIFEDSSKNLAKKVDVIPSMSLISQTLSYASEWERII